MSHRNGFHLICQHLKRKPRFHGMEPILGSGTVQPLCKVRIDIAVQQMQMYAVEGLGQPVDVNMQWVVQRSQSQGGKSRSGPWRRQPDGD